MTRKDLKKILEIPKKRDELKKISPKAEAAFRANVAKNSVYYSNLLEGNKLTKKDAFRAMGD